MSFSLSFQHSWDYETSKGTCTSQDNVSVRASACSAGAAAALETVPVALGSRCNLPASVFKDHLPPSISCWGLNEGDEYTGISLIMIKVFEMQVLERVLEMRRELRHLQGCWLDPRDLPGFLSPSLGAVQGTCLCSGTVPSSPQDPWGNFWLCTYTGTLHMHFFLPQSGVHP